MKTIDPKLEDACREIENLCRSLGRDCQVIFADRGVSIAPLEDSGDSFGKTFYDALKEALESKE